MDGGVQYDILVPSDYMIEKLIAEDRLAELDLSKIENYANINDSFKSPAYDPENKYSIPYMWGTLGICITLPWSTKRWFLEHSLE